MTTIYDELLADPEFPLPVVTGEFLPLPSFADTVVEVPASNA